MHLPLRCLLSCNDRKPGRWALKGNIPPCMASTWSHLNTQHFKMPGSPQASLFICDWAEITMGFPGGTVAKIPLANTVVTGAMGLIPGSGRSPGGGNGNPLQYFCLENPMDRGARRTAVHRVTKKLDMIKWWSTHVNHDGKENEIEYIYMYNQITAVQQKLIQHSKSSIL